MTKLSASDQIRVLLRLVADLPEPRRFRWIKSLVLAGEITTEDAEAILEARSATDGRLGIAHAS